MLMWRTSWLRRSIAIGLTLLAPSAVAQLGYSESFNSSTAPNWVLGDSAILTAPSIDPAGAGYLRLTSAAGNQKGYAYLNQAFPAPLGLEIDFEYLAWGGSGADGLVAFLYDGSITGSAFKIGDFGGGLGYCQGYASNATTGLSGAYVGVGLDEFGNFSSRNDRCPDASGNNGAVPDAIAVRGPGNGTTGYALLGRTGTLAQGIDSPGGTTRPAASSYYRRMRIQVLPNSPTVGTTYTITVDLMTTQNGAWVRQLGPLTLPSAPPTLRLGFAASTGGSSNNHEIRNVFVRVAADISVAKSVNLTSAKPYDPVQYVLNVSNPSAQVTVANATIVDTLPATTSNVTWVCVGVTGGATCAASSGAGNAINLSVTLPPNSSLSVTINAIFAPTAAATTVTNSASVNSPPLLFDPNLGNNTSSASTVVVGFVISGVTYLDANHNANPESGEAGLSGRTVTLSSGATAISDASGFYQFTNLPLGTYTLSGNALASHIVTDVNPRSVTIATENRRENFGYFRGALISGNVFRDDGYLTSSAAPYSALVNANNAIRDGAEVGVAGVPMTLTASAPGTADATLTDGNGDYVLWVGIPSGSDSTVSVGHTLNAPTGSNIAGSSVALAATLGDALARTRAFAVTAGTVYGGRNFGVLDTLGLAPDQSGQVASPGAISYTHLLRPSTLGPLRLTPVGSNGYTYTVYADDNCDGVISSAERMAGIAVPSGGPAASLTVNANWPREAATGRFKACTAEVLVSASSGRPAGESTTVTLTARLLWQNNAGVLQLASARDTTVIGGSSGGLTLAKQVRNVTTSTALSTTGTGRPNETLEYCVTYSNNASTPVTNIVMRDPVPSFTVFVSGSIRVVLLGVTTVLTDAIDGDAGEFDPVNRVVTVRLGNLAAGATGVVCYQVKIL